MAIEDPWDYIWEWWQNYQADPKSDATKIESGLKKQQISAESLPPNVDQATKSNLQTGACQYWVKGLPCVCDYWDSEKRVCTFVVASDKSNMPTGYGVGGCDGLGRRSWCSEYTSSESFDPNKYVCVLPCLEKSGSGKVIRTETTLIIEPWLPEEIKGYNPDDKNVGQCDGMGMGRGVEGFGIIGVEELYRLPPVCKHYKPHQLGFGAVVPRPYHGKPETSTVWKEGQTFIPKDLVELHDGSPADPLVLMDKRLPFSFLVYNQRAQFQKCAHWDSDTGGVFYFDDYGADPSYFQISIDQEASGYCMKAREGDSIVLPYATIDDEAVDVPWVLYNVWAKCKSVVCNGAKPECPCYTGKWIYCIDKNMQDGMRITADQIFELRFWASNWSSQEEYDKYYARKPGPTVEGYSDITTADLYTFTKWFKGGFLADDSIMQGNKHHMCMPAPLQHRIFSKEQYITVEAVVYPKAGEYEGTTTTDNVAYPTLVRELDSADNLHPDILVIYPYNTLDPWNEYPCDDSDRPAYCYLNHNIMYGKPHVMVVGQCIRNKKVWAINPSSLYGSTIGGSSGPFADMRRYIRSQLIPRYEYFTFCRELEEVIKDAESEYTDGIVSGITDEYGFFKIDGLELLSEGTNEIFVVCQFAGGDFPQYTYRRRVVISRYFGGLITQNKFIHLPGGDEDSENGQENTMPAFYTPAADMSGIVKIVNGSVSSVFSVFSHYQYGISGDVAYYSYCINAYTETQDDLQEWVQIGPTGYIWAEIPDIRISYLFDFTVEEAYLSPRPTFDTEGTASYSASLCGTDMDSYDNLDIPLEHIPFEDSMRKTAPPNAVLLKSSIRPKDFFNTDWKLSITYTFTILENKVGDNPVFPPGIGGTGGLAKFTSPGFRIEHSEGRPYFDIFGIGGEGTQGTAAVMAYIVDRETERIQAAAATKMLYLGHILSCRGVDIEYEYGVDVAAYKLVPETGFFTWIGPPYIVGDPMTTEDHNRHYRKAKCGDHDCPPGNCIGPMWFPYNDCTTIDFYDMVNGAASCTMPIIEGAEQLKAMGRAAWRYCTADEFNCWVSVGGNWAAACGTSFTYYYSRTWTAEVFANETGQHGSSNSMEFTGTVRKMGQINKMFYYVSGWALPPFGNTGREMVERWLIRDYASFYDLSLGQPIPRSEYMPMVLDREDLAADVDCFKSPGISSHPNLNEPFCHRSMLSNYLANWLTETMAPGRFEFSDILELQYHGNCMYPWPSKLGEYSFEVVRYKFKDDDSAWVWPEYWKDIERTSDSSSIPFKFVVLERPAYYYDVDKKEHRLITKEGNHMLLFRPPQKDEESGEFHASISLDGVHWRFFNIVYDSYSEGYVSWADESAEGAVGGSGGEGEEGAGGGGGSIYETANNGEDTNGQLGQDPIWIHDFDTIFDEEASADPSEDRKALIGFGVGGYEIFGYYNRGLIARIPKSRLNKLPTRMDSLGSGQVVSGDLSYGAELTSNVVLHWDSSDLSEITPTKLVVTGRWGVWKYSADNETIFSLPGVDCGESHDGAGGSGIPEFPPSIYSQLPRTGQLAHLSTGSEGVSKFTITVDLNTYPTRITNPPDYFQVRLTHYGNESLLIESVELFGETYIESQEDLFVWERRYRISKITSSYTYNTDGSMSDDFRSYDESLKNAGQYFPSRNNQSFEEGGDAISKMVMLTAEKYYGEEENEEIETTYETLRTVEKEEQRKLYDKAYYLDYFDTIDLNGFYPPDVEYFLTKVIKKGSMRPGNCQLTDVKIYWTDLKIKKAFTQEGTFFQPGGHWFNWSPNYVEMRCYLFGPVKIVYSVEIVHHRHATGGSTGRGEYSTANAGESYMGATRLEYYEGRYWNLKTLGQSEAGQPTDVITQSVFYSSPAQVRA